MRPRSDPAEARPNPALRRRPESWRGGVAILTSFAALAMCACLAGALNMADALAGALDIFEPLEPGQAALYRVTYPDGSQGYLSVNIARPNADNIAYAAAVVGRGRAIVADSIYTNWQGTGLPQTRQDLFVRAGGGIRVLSQTTPDQAAFFDPPLELWSMRWLLSNEAQPVSGATSLGGGRLEYTAWCAGQTTVQLPNGETRLAVEIVSEWRLDGQVIERSRAVQAAGVGQALYESHDANGNLTLRMELLNSTRLSPGAPAAQLPLAELVATGGGEAAFFREGPRRLGAHPDVTLAAPQFAITQRFAAGAGFTASPTYAGGVVYLADQSGSVMAYVLGEETPLWSFGAGGPVVGAPAVAGGIVYFGSAGKTLYALDAASGMYLWSIQSRDNFAASPVVEGGVLYVGAEDRVFYALDARSGAERWRFVARGRLVSSPALADGRVVFGDSDGLVYALDAVGGKLLWTAVLDGPVEATPAIGDDGLVYAASLNGQLAAIDAASGEIVWDFTNRFGHIASPALGGGRLYAADSSGAVRAFDAASGALLWELLPRGSDSPFTSSQLLLGGHLVGVDTAGSLRVWNAASGAELHRLSVGDTVTASPTWTGEALLLTNHEGELLTLQPDSSAAFRLPTSEPE